MADIVCPNCGHHIELAATVKRTPVALAYRRSVELLKLEARRVERSPSPDPGYIRPKG